MLNASSPSRSRSSSAPSTMRSLDNPSREPGAASGWLDIEPEPSVHLYRTLVRKLWEVPHVERSRLRGGRGGLRCCCFLRRGACAGRDGLAPERQGGLR